METLRVNIIDERKLKGITQQEMAALLKMALSTYASWEQGKSEPSAEMIVKLADIFQVSTDYLLGHSETIQSGGQGVTPLENKMLQAFRKLEPADQNRFVNMLLAFGC